MNEKTEKDTAGEKPIHLCDSCTMVKGLNCIVKPEDVTYGPSENVIGCVMHDLTAEVLNHPIGIMWKVLKLERGEELKLSEVLLQDYEVDAYRTNLCDTCGYDVATCEVKIEDVGYGLAEGGDNVIHCVLYDVAGRAFKLMQEAKGCDTCDKKSECGLFNTTDAEEKEDAPAYVAPEFAADTDYVRVKTMFSEFEVPFGEDLNDVKEPVIFINIVNKEPKTVGLVGYATYYSFDNEGKFKSIGIIE